MKKKLAYSILTILIALYAVGLTACGESTPNDNGTHTHSYTSTVTKPTCTEKGYTTYTCACGDSYMDNETNATGHTEELRNVKVATEAEQGYSGDKYCQTCNVFLQAGQVLEKLEHTHSMQKVDKKDKTCTANGNIEYYTCTKCHKNYNDNIGTTELLNEDMVILASHGETEIRNTKPATEEEKGYTGDTHCKVCGEKLSNGQEIPKLNHTHNMVKTDRKEATCTINGNIEYYTCTKCEKKYNDNIGTIELSDSDIVIEASHNLTHIVRKEATCTVNGNIEYWHCLKCEKIFTNENATTETDNVVINASHGETEIRNAKEATEDEKGYTGDTHCKVCGEKLSNGQEIPKLDHTHNMVKTDYKGETCTANGNIEYYTCTKCNKKYNDNLGTMELSDEDTVILAKHILSQHNAKTPTCEDFGWDAYEECSRCDYSTYNELEELGHKYGTPTYEWSENNSKCTATRICSRDSTHTETETVDSIISVMQNKTCELDELTKYTVAFTNTAFAKKVKENIKTADKLGHKFANYFSDNNATCTEDGTKTATCDNGCWAIDTITDENSKTGHSFVNYVYNNNATETVNGTETATCDNGCGATDTITIENTFLSGLTFTDMGTYYEVTDFDNSRSTVIIPSVYNGLPVLSIGDWAFEECNSLTNIAIPNSVTSIGYYSFYLCDSLQSITIPSSIKSIGDGAFSCCFDLAKVTIENGVTSIGDSAFWGCSSLTNATIPDSVISIGGSAFERCSSLESITLPFVGSSKTATTSSASTLFGYIFGDYKYDGSIATIQVYSSGSGKTYYIPSTLKSVTINGGEILYGAFYNCSMLTSVTIGDNVTKIADCAFYNCTGLTEINLNATSISGISSSNDAFYNVGQAGNGTTINIGANMNRIPDYFFYQKSAPNITSVVFADNSACKSIGFSAFSGCSNLRSVTFGANSNLESISYSAFKNCTALCDVYINDLEAWCNIYFSDYYSNPLYCAEDLYLNNQLATNLVIPDSVTEIKKYAFYYCNSLTSVTFEDTSTWYVTSNSSYTGGTEIDVTNASQNATLLKSTYFSKYWYKTEK